MFDIYQFSTFKSVMALSLLKIVDDRLIRHRRIPFELCKYKRLYAKHMKTFFLLFCTARGLLATVLEQARND